LDFQRNTIAIFDQGYITVTPDLRLRVGKRLRDDYENGRTYYPFDGSLLTIPAKPEFCPAREHLEWHNSERYRG
jgi:putative restriction endonuclease